MVIYIYQVRLLNVEQQHDAVNQNKYEGKHIMGKPYKKIQIPIGDEDIRMFEDLTSGLRKPFTWTFDKIDVEFIKDGEGEELEITPVEQSALNRIADSYLYANFPKTSNGIYARAEVEDLVPLDDIAGQSGDVEAYIVNITYGQQDDCHDDAYHNTVAVRLDVLKGWVKGNLDRDEYGKWVGGCPNFIADPVY